MYHEKEMPGFTYNYEKHNYQYQQMNNRLSPQFTEHKKYHAVGCWNSRYWHGTNTKMWITTTTSSLQIWIKFWPQNLIVEVGNILWSQNYSWKWLLASSDYIRANNKHKNIKSVCLLIHHLIIETALSMKTETQTWGQLLSNVIDYITITLQFSWLLYITLRLHQFSNVIA
jgi:hypothetical protein